MSDPAAALTLERARATSYRSSGRLYFLVQLRARAGDGRRLEGMGLSSRRALAGSRGGTSWEVLTECLRRLEGRTIAVPGPTAAAAPVRELMTEMSTVASERAEAVALVAGDRARPARPPGSTERPSVARRLVRRLRRRARSLVRLVRRLRPFTVRRVRRVARRGWRRATSVMMFWRRPEPFQSTMRGLEGALVDLVSRGLQAPPARMRGLRYRRLRPHVPFPYGEEDHQDELFEQVLARLVESVAFPALPLPTHQGQPSTTYDEVPYLKPLGSNGTKGHLLEREALMLGLATTRFSKGAFLATDHVHPPLIFKWSRTPRSSAVSLALCTHKEATRMRLDRAGVPVPKGRTFAYGAFESAIAFAARIGYPVVIKPAMGVRGIGVVADIRNEEDLRGAFDQLVNSRLGRDDFIVEKHVHGRDYRIVVVGDRVIAAILREPASVEGDGEHTVAELMVNKNLFRRLNPHLWGRPIKYSTAARYQLQRAGLSLTSVPAAGEKVVLSNTCSLSQGGDSIDVLDELHPSIKEASVQAVEAVPGLWFCGLDFLLEDHTRPLAGQEAGICELNAHAAIGNCEYPLYGAPRQVARTVMQQCVEHFGLQVNDKPAEHLALKLTIRGKVTRVGYRTWLWRHARNFGLTGWVRNIDAQTVEAVIVGDAVPVTALTAATVLGPRRARPTSVSTEHISPPGTDDFEVRWDGPESEEDEEIATDESRELVDAD